MKHVKNGTILTVLLASEALWMAYAIILFTGSEWGRHPFFDYRWWLIAGIAGYIVNRILVGRVHYLIPFVVNVVVLGIILFQNWKLNGSEITLTVGISLSIAVTILFIRSVLFVYREPKRTQMLGHFEGNVIFYIVFMLLFLGTDWFTGAMTFHLLFVAAIFFSLIGMVFTLQSHEESDGQEPIDIYKVGQSGWFAGVAVLFLVAIASFCLLLLIPAVRTGLYTLAVAGWDGLKWLWTVFLRLMEWFAGLFPEQSEMEGELPPTEEMPALPEGAEEPIRSIPLEWLIAIGAVIAVVVLVLAFWFISRWLRNRKFTPAVKVDNIVIARSSWWRVLLDKWTAFVRWFRRQWRMRFPRYYKAPVYWYYHQLVRWGKKNGIPRLSYETASEYVKKISGHLKDGQTAFSYEGQKYDVIQLLNKLSRAYEATYYGGKIGDSVSEVQPLFHYLKSLQKKRKRQTTEVS